MIEKTMEVDRMEDVISVFGSFDQNLRMIETEYNVRVTDRDEQIHITGEAENVLYAEKAIAGLLSLAAKGEEIGEQNVRYIFRLVREGREQKIQELAGDVVCITAKGKPIKAKTLGQRAYLDAIEQNTITLGVGPAGTGKTYLAVAEAVAAFRAERVNRIILTRPAVEAGEKLGFLPGDMKEKLDPYLQPLYDALIEEDIECSVFVARARRGLTGISAAYQEIKESMREKKGICGIQFASPNMEYYYPLDWETQLVRAIREGSEKRAQAILQQLYEENQRLGLSYTLICRVATLLYETMRRIILEEKLPVQMFLKMEEPQHGMTLEQAFDRARNTVNTLCEQIMQKKQQAATNVNRSLVSYVNEHLHDPDLSLNLLSDHFGVSNASVSRIFKNTVGQNFYNYITEKRMAKAKELLVLKGYCPREITTEIGYDNEYSFKRAFQRTYGITPRDFLEKEGKNAR